MSNSLFLRDLAVVACELNEFETAWQSIDAMDTLFKSVAPSILIRDLLRKRHVKESIIVADRFEQNIKGRSIGEFTRELSRHGDARIAFRFAVGLKSVYLRAHAVSMIVESIHRQ